ncbi:hypothetical protein [Rickettsiales endosymbiont of Trichoplax sp. H2]|uniref:hypothetical protein n=1 Tax=Rickettsiales endosymbiont of Trichoplax sp. H2 TaxID=2021221 RepID=UPI0012B1A13F|nr:hypothetical protein [Rickettsiales endosymbiont of Trichoplax sp. H2]MSO13502.1 hypothetical protein [Rickettsiales endosymbiont of Trichoplax sp. H2]
MKADIGITLSKIEEIREELIAKLCSVKNEIKNYGEVKSDSKSVAINYANSKQEEANNHYQEMKGYIEKHKGTDKLVKQLIRHMASIDGYAKKIENLCGNGN